MKICFWKPQHVEFTNYFFKRVFPFALFTEFESMVLPYNDEQKLSKTNKYQNHIPFSVGYFFNIHMIIAYLFTIHTEVWFGFINNSNK